MMIQRRVFTITGAVFIIAGILFLLNSLSKVTGFYIFKDETTGVGAVVGPVLIIIGLAVIFGLGKIVGRFRGTESLREHNKEGRRVAEISFYEEYGRKPTKPELREYLRELHESGALHEISEDVKGRKYAKSSH